ncbi:hypothetical protein EDD37DRAFT_638207 [Exophiala viscosa]|uniref:uncharacterized protein n=1 Tax=Exophiala viscosa TaxID=2486360 RepID=UPI002196F9A2|nr:hypothetical protein EDD37DRAFT_638207 [Exophiala viscosa]
MCEAHGWEYVQYTTSAGDDNARKRADSMFKNNPSVRIMIASTKMGSQGFNWHMANTVVFLTLDHTPGVVDQCIKRAARFPNSRDVHVFTTRAQESIDTHIEQDICAPKREQNQKLLMSSKLEGFATFDEISSMDAKQIVSMLDSKEMPDRGHTTLWAPGVLQ